jgi:hypothetical protein
VNSTAPRRIRGRSLTRTDWAVDAAGGNVPAGRGSLYAHPADVRGAAGARFQLFCPRPRHFVPGKIDSERQSGLGGIHG